MALIVCPECGKRFSDKAPSCPECGCPTSAIVGEAAVGPAAREQLRTETSQKMLEAVRQTRSRAKAAEADFDRSSADIQWQASREIDLFGGDFHSRIVDLAAGSRRACDDLYASYQTLIESLDRSCRPLLEYGPSAEAIKAVWDLIVFLNDESEIENNFSASFNGASLGNVGSAKYVPKMSNKMIQKFWGDQYASTPEAQEAQRRRQEARQAEQERQAQRRRQEEEARRRERERKAAQAREGKARLQQLNEEAGRRAQSFRGALEQARRARMEEVRSALAEELSALETEKAELEREVAALGVFRSGAKRTKKDALALVERKLGKLRGPDLLDAEEQRLRQLADSAFARYQQTVESYLDKRFPGRKTGKDDVARYLEDGDFARRPLPEAPDAATAFDGKGDV